MRKERFITERKGKNGTSYLVRIRFEDETISKTFSEREYASCKLAFDSAIKFRNQTLVDIANNNINRKSTITVKEVFEDYLINCPLRYNTKYKHQKLFNRYVLNKDVPVQELTKAMILNDLNSMIDIATTDTIQRVYYLYKNCIIYNAINHDYISKDLTIGLKVPQSRIYSRPKSTVTDRETIERVKTILINKGTYDCKLLTYLIEILYFTGMRPAEAEALTREDFYENFIDVNKELGSDSECVNVVRQCKTYKSIRKVPIHPQLKPIIENLLEFSKYNDVFRRENGMYLDSTWAGNLMRRLLKGTGVRFTLYQLRHNMATALVTSQVDARTIMDILGHSNYSMSLDYANSSEELKNNALLNLQ